MQNSTALTTGELNIYERIARAQLQITALIVCRHVPFLFTDFLIPVLKNAFDDSNTLQDVSLNRHKVHRIISKIYAPAHKERLILF